MSDTQSLNVAYRKTTNITKKLTMNLKPYQAGTMLNCIDLQIPVFFRKNLLKTADVYV